MKRLLGPAAFLVLRHQPRVGLFGGAPAHQGGPGKMGDGAEQHGQSESEGGDELREEPAAALQGDGRRGKADTNALIEKIEGRLLAEILPHGAGRKLLEHPVIVDLDRDSVKGGEMQAVLHGLQQPGVRKLPAAWAR